MRFCSSDDEGSEDEEEEGGDDEQDEQLDDEEQEDDDDDYHEVEEEQQENEIHSHSKQNGFPKNISSKPEVVSGLSNMMAKFDFNVNSPFNFGSPSSTDTQSKTNRWPTLQNLDKMKEHLKVISNHFSPKQN